MPKQTMRTRPLHLLIRLLLLVMVIGCVIFFIVIPVGFGIAATTMPHQTVGEAPQGFENVVLTTDDGIGLAAWYAIPQNGAVIILVHGAGNSREGVRTYAEMLKNHDFGVLAFDLRGHGASEGKTNLYGWKGNEDVAAAVKFLSTKSDVKAIGGLGLSLGGEVMLGAASDNPTIKAIVSEGATHRTMEEFRAIPSHQNPVVGLQSWVSYSTVYLLTGEMPGTSIANSITAAWSTHFLFIAAADATDEEEFNRVYAEATSAHSELWVIPDGGHIGGFSHYPVEYEQRVTQFFTTALLEG